MRTLALGASGFIPKSEGRDVLLSALELVLAGGVYIPPVILGREDATSSRPNLRQVGTRRGRILTSKDHWRNVDSSGEHQLQRAQQDVAPLGLRNKPGGTEGQSTHHGVAVMSCRQHHTRK